MATIMAGAAAIGHDHLRVVPRSGLPQRRSHIDRRRVTGVAISRSCRRNMHSRFTNRNRAVVAGRASARHRNALVMLPGRGAPCRSLCRMAGDTVGRSGHVVCRFTDPAAAARTVAGQAICCGGKTGVIGHGACPTGGRTVATFTIASHGNVDCRTGT